MTHSPQETSDPDGWLVMIFGSVLGLGFAPASLGDAFRVSNVAYHCADPDFLTAFVDRLLDGDGRVVGFYVSAVSESGAKLVNSALNAPYLRHDNGGLEVWLSEAPISGARNAGEQAFGGRVFFGSDETMAMTIDMSGLLTSDDVDRLRLAHAHHVAIDGVS